VALCACGSVAAVKAPYIAQALILGPGGAAPSADSVYVDLVLTQSAGFFQRVLYRKARPQRLLDELLALTDAEGTPYLQVWTDEDEWRDYAEVGGAEGTGRVLHIDLAKRNRVLVFAPLSANTLAKLALGLCDNLASCLARAWEWDADGDAATEDGGSSTASSFLSEDGTPLVVVEESERPVIVRGGPRDKPVVLAPAMNTVMWNQSVTQQHLSVLRDRGAEVITPAVKLLACGDRGKGALASVEEIVERVREALVA